MWRHSPPVYEVNCPAQNNVVSLVAVLRNSMTVVDSWPHAQSSSIVAFSCYYFFINFFFFLFSYFFSTHSYWPMVQQSIRCLTFKEDLITDLWLGCCIRSACVDFIKMFLRRTFMRRPTLHYFILRWVSTNALHASAWHHKSLGGQGARICWDIPRRISCWNRRTIVEVWLWGRRARWSKQVLFYLFLL